MGTAAERREELKAVWRQAQSCTNCPQLASTRQTVVFGSGNADADLMFIGEAPGANEDKQGLPFVGQAGRLLDTLLEEIGLTRGDVFIANVLKCLRYTTMVQLGDGSWERIGRLVRSGYAGTVMSVDDDGRLVAKRVTGWHATPLGDRPIYRVTYRSAKSAGAGKVSAELTGDHPVLTERGYVPAAELTPSDRVATGQGLSEVAHDVVCGSLLGDGSIRAASSAFTFSHSADQRDYALFKVELLRELAPCFEERQVAAVVGGQSYDVVMARTSEARALRLIRADYYRPKKIVPEWIAEELNPRMLAFWFMDDGYCRIRGGGRRPLAEIAAVGFSDADRQVLLRGLQRLGLPAKASRGRIYFDVVATRALSEVIAPFVPPSMRYKLVPEVREAVPFAPARLEPGPRRVLYDDVEIEDITDKARADRTFFCIDVEDTHNFVTAGGVVHNCRPPGNRDPLPQEIDACQDYLFRQLELIEPRVVCTLGNFSTKLLRGDPTGITRLHGREEVRRIGPRRVRLFPIYHPAAALYTPKMLDILREDFQRLPALLALDPPEQPEPEPELVVPEPEVAAAPEPEPAPVAQLGLF
ncbi:MAG TPA: uracil-DNA glycosylase family protein [Solirubrobacteraceae bacterium]